VVVTQLGASLSERSSTAVRQTDGVVRAPSALIGTGTTGGDDVVYANAGNDLAYGGAGRDLLVGGAGQDTLFGEAGDDDLVGGSMTAGVADGADFIDGGAGDDVIAGDNASITGGATLDPRMRVLQGTQIYGTTAGAGGNDGQALVTAAAQANPSGTRQRTITLLDHSDTTPAALAGDDHIAGGAGRDLIFGGLGDDVIQGDAALELLVLSAGSGGIPQLLPDPVGAARDADGDLVVTASREQADDGDDYIEGNGGNDVIFGNLGQDDLIGGSSDLFGLTSAAQRIDGADLIFGGAGADLARNDRADTTHARDADAIAGDNADIFRIVSVTGGVSSYRTFNYDNPTYNALPGAGIYDATLKLIPRAVTLLDYTPGGLDVSASAAQDRGAADELHGESGDDSIYGMRGNDVLLGGAGDDDVIGGTGHDWISGGTGNDGVLGDDGRIVTSRNTTVGEPLSGVAGFASTDLNRSITTPGRVQQAVINVANALKKTVNLTPYYVDPTGGNPLFDPVQTAADDLIYGGWGNDFLHGGVGDDGISGGEALEEAYALDATLTGLVRSDYTRPFNSGDMLRFNASGYGESSGQHTRAGEFATYDEYDPLRRILLNDTWTVSGGWLDKTGTGRQWLLNHEADQGAVVVTGIYTDGEDAIFGDLGNDWLVGGTGRDNLYGGWGDDLLQADDDLRSASGVNNVQDTQASYADRAYGGAGRDVLIANTEADRLIDWVNAFNTFLLPAGPSGGATFSKAQSPQLPEFLYALSAADGADPTRADDEGTSAVRNGEPGGELGLLVQQDKDYASQTGGTVSFIQAGTIPEGPRDTLRTANFNDGLFQGFAVDSGTFVVNKGKLEISATSTSGDAVAVSHQLEELPVYYELSASISVVKPTKGWKANAYLIFDYQSASDFKFAGLDISTSKIVMGRRTQTGWVVDDQGSIPGSLSYGTIYNLLLSVNGTTVTLIANNTNVFTHTYAPRVIEGVSYALNYGLVGFGSNQSRGQLDTFEVKVLPPQSTWQSTADFGSGAGPLFAGTPLGNWSVSGGAYTGAPAAGMNRAISLADIGVTLQAADWLEISGQVKTTRSAGFVFDRYADDDFKFVALDVVADRVLMGHHTARTGFVVDAGFARTLDAGVAYTLTLSLRGSTVAVSVNSGFAGSFAYNALAVDGRFGLLARDAAATFDNVTVRTDNVALQGSQQALIAQTYGTADAPVSAPDAAVLRAMTDAALHRLALTAQQREQLGDIRIEVADLPGLQLGQWRDGRVWIDLDAAGHGWFVDATPWDDREFAPSRADRLEGRIDLLSVLAHEIGHALGLEHAGGGMMAEQLAGATRLPLDRGRAAPGMIEWPSLPQPGDVAPAVAVATIDWALPAQQPQVVKPRSAGAEERWQLRFVNHLGAGSSDPNAKLSLRLPVAPRLDAR
jgi:Ca2+-binding RTX toxin-like protein